MRTFTSLALALTVLATSGFAMAREVDADSSLEAPPARVETTKSRAKESTVAAKYDASYPTRDMSRVRKPGSI